MFPRWRDIFIFRNSKRLVTGNLAWGERVDMTAQVINRVCRLWFCCLVGQCNGSTTTTYLVGWEYCPAVCTPPFRNWKYFQGLKTTINFQQRYRIPLQVLFVNTCSTDVNSCLEGACCIVVDNLITSIIQKKCFHKLRVEMVIKTTARTASSKLLPVLGFRISNSFPVPSFLWDECYLLVHIFKL